MRRLIQESKPADAHLARFKPPRLLVQFWDDPTTMAADVRECMDSWRPLEKEGFERVLYDDSDAQGFIEKYFVYPCTRAHERCSHPAMKCDYFRLCFIAKLGGFYVDADDVYQGGECAFLFRDSALKLQPLCYDTSTETMMPSAIFTSRHHDSPDWILCQQQPARRSTFSPRRSPRAGKVYEDSPK
jgi:hypothetical protein